MRVKVVQIFRFASVDVARDVEDAIVGRVGNFGYRHHAGVAVQFGLLVEDIHDLVEILSPQSVLVAVLEEVLAGVNHEDAGASVSILLVNNQNAGGDAGAVESIGGQADDALDHALPDELPTDIRLSVAAKQHTMRQDDGAFAPAIKRRNEVAAERRNHRSWRAEPRTQSGGIRRVQD